MRDYKAEFAAERKHWNDLKRKYLVYTSRVTSDEVDECDTERVIKCLMNHFREDESQVIARLESSNIDNPVSMNDEVFWIEK